MRVGCAVGFGWWVGVGAGICRCRPWDDVLCGFVYVCWCRDAVAVVVFVELRDVRCAQVLRCDDDDRGRFLALCGCDCMVEEH